MYTTCKGERRSIRAGVAQARMNNTGVMVAVHIVTSRRVGCPYTELAPHESHQPLMYQESK